MASTLKLTDLQHPSSGVSAITVGSDNSVSIVGGAISPQTGFKNRIINGAMTIDQRNAGAAVTVNTSGAFYAADRFRLSGVASSGVFTGQVVPDAPAGFTNSLKVTVNTADASLTTTDTYYCVQPIEGYNVADLNFGSANAAVVTYSFWVKSSITGSFGGSLVNEAGNRSYPFNYTISAANTWEYKTVTIQGDTTGSWPNTNGIGFRMYFSLGVSSDYQGTANQWNGAFDIAPTSSVALISTLNATWQVTGVQLEKGSVATPFEFRSIGQELALCQRYFEVTGSIFVSSVVGRFPSSYWKVQKRATPTLVILTTGIGSPAVTAFTAESLSGFYQSVNAVADTNAAISGSAEL
jgi:hypothetical protein